VGGIGLFYSGLGYCTYFGGRTRNGLFFGKRGIVPGCGAVELAETFG